MISDKPRLYQKQEHWPFCIIQICFVYLKQQVVAKGSKFKEHTFKFSWYIPPPPPKEVVRLDLGVAGVMATEEEEDEDTRLIRDDLEQVGSIFREWLKESQLCGLCLSIYLSVRWMDFYYNNLQATGL